MAKKQLLDFIKMVSKGECDIDVENVIKHFNICCRVYKVENDYTLVEFQTNFKQMKFKAHIHAADAKRIITEKGLMPFTKTAFGKKVTIYSPVK